MSRAALKGAVWGLVVLWAHASAAAPAKIRVAAAEEVDANTRSTKTVSLRFYRGSEDLDPEVFYRMVGRPQLAEIYLGHRRTNWLLVGAGSVLMVAGAATVVTAFALSLKGSALAWSAGGGGVAVLAGLGLGSYAGTRYPHPIEAAEARALAQGFNDSLERPDDSRSGLRPVLLPWWSDHGAGATLIARF